jgi:pimeloyl-ACP methyl ester carboxylesterase
MSLEKKVKVNNVYISYAEAGSPDAMPVIFIHGFPFSKAMWAGQLEILKNDYRAIAYDVRGHGNSEAGLMILVSVCLPMIYWHLWMSYKFKGCGVRTFYGWLYCVECNTKTTQSFYRTYSYRYSMWR